MLSIRQLEAFVWTVRLKTLSRAAAKLNMAQPTISKRIQELELACGFEVFDKVGRSVAVTPQGTLLYELAEKILSLVSQVEDIRDQPPESPRTIALGVTELAAYTWLPRLVNLLAERFPLVTSHVVIEQSASLLTKLRTGELDLIVTPSFVPERDFIDIRACRWHSWQARIYAADGTSTQGRSCHNSRCSLMVLGQVRSRSSVPG